MGAAAASPPPLSMPSLITSAVLLVALLAAFAGAQSPHIFTSNQTESRHQLHQLSDCAPCTHNTEDAQVKSTNPQPKDKDVTIVVTYNDPSGAIQNRRVKSKDLSASWVWKDPDQQTLNSQALGNQFHQEMKLSESTEGLVKASKLPVSLVHPAKLKRRMLRQERRQQRAAELIQQSKEMDDLMQEAAIERARELDTSIPRRYSIWKKDYENPNSDSTVKLMHDQIIMARAYATIAKDKNETILYDVLLKRARENQFVVGEATFDSELQPSALISAKRMGHSLSEAKDKLFNSIEMAKKLRAMLQSTEGNLSAQRKKSAFLTQLAAKTVPKPLHCISLRLTTDYYFLGYDRKELPHKEKLEDPSLYHYAIFSDNVLATSVVVSSAVLHAKEPEKHVFHIVTDKLNFAAMKMWFLANPPGGATIQVENIDAFTWLNSSYCPVLRQLESARMIEYYFKAHQANSLAAGADNLKYRNPKYLSMLNHLRFYLPEVYPKLDKILFLDDDIVVQKDLTPLWSVDLEGRVNGAVETCKESFHRFDKYLNFSNPLISKNFHPNACGWAYGMNVFDLKEWKIRNITGIYHYWQNGNEDRTLWKLGTLPPGLITFYNLTHPLDKSWHVLGLGYDPALNLTQIENAAVVHYNGNYKPWLDLAIAKYKPYWSKYVIPDNPYLEACNVAEKQNSVG